LKQAVILLGHGSQADGGNAALREVAVLIKKQGGVKVIPAYLQFCEPSLPQAFEQAVAEGVERVVVVPYFLHMGNHVARDIPEELDRLRASHPGVLVVLTEHLGAHPKLAEIALERIKETG
jgi:sirohydrochlorin ferrochelatase